jgi:hypothetical protein
MQKSTKHRKESKLILQAETIRILRSEQVKWILGAFPTSPGCNSGGGHACQPTESCLSCEC